MRSIRLSLVLYFVGLLTVALGVASLLVYQSAATTLADKQRATSQLIEARYQQRCAEERNQLDERLRDQAFALASRVRVRIDWSKMTHRKLHWVGGTMAAAGMPMGHLTAAPWLLQVHFPIPRRSLETGDTSFPYPYASPFAFHVWRLSVTDVTLNESDLELETGRAAPEPYYQIDTNDHWAKPLRSKSLRGRTLPSPEEFGGSQPLHWELDTLELTPGHPVRRLTVKSSSARQRFIRPPRPSGMGPPSPLVGPPRPGPSRRRPSDPQPLFILIQVAADLADLNARLDALTADRDGEMESVRAESAVSLARMRARLLAIAALTFAATVFGTFWLVWAGLWPLRRLSDAVSQVSPRDFRLPLSADRLPAELQPIVERLVVTLDALKRAFAREKQATADLSHELRTPLAALLTTTELALRKVRTPDQYQEMMHDIRASAKQMNQIVERLLTLARLDAGVDRCRPQPVDVARLAEQCAAVVRPLAEASGLKLTVSTSSPAPEGEGTPTQVTTDPDKLREVVNNLLHNAIQYNRPDGRIDLTVARENGHVRVEVSDSGVGIPAEARERIFERFYRADPSRNSDGLHAGLGLAIVKEYLDLLGGRIAVESREGEGSVFRIELPAHRGDPC